MPVALIPARPPRLSREVLARAVPSAGALGHDAFGLSLDTLGRALPVLEWLHDTLPVVATGLDELPETGPTLIFTNHAGPLPVGALALAAALLLDTRAPRLPRVELEPWAASAPWIGLLLRRLGHVVSQPRNLAALLERGELAVHAPPAALVGRGLGPFRREALRLAVRARATVIPVGIRGASAVLPVWRLRALGALLGTRTPPFIISGLPRRSEVRIALGKARRLEAVLDGPELDEAALGLEDEIASLLA
jgi:hypothetical protein